ncbi:hypothetical protein [Halarchaeum acidiphilum]|uniref:hypothetical protein n=1 Tax=Halarchaeum acidiphilum TaxID=489138 RepID=UPI0005D1CEDE|nr:hypothetical protein [Halarchaeum acidiphilum]
MYRVNRCGRMNVSMDTITATERWVFQPSGGRPARFNGAGLTSRMVFVAPVNPPSCSGIAMAKPTSATTKPVP